MIETRITITETKKGLEIHFKSFPAIATPREGFAMTAIRDLLDTFMNKVSKDSGFSLQRESENPSNN